MRKILGLILLPMLFPHVLSSQDIAIDTTLQEVVIQAYSSNKSLQETPAAVGLVTEKDLLRYNNTSLLPSVNTIPGVRMEERSPGSYRFSIRGSLIRSPFGVRNVKVYWNNLPFTDGGGNTYLNLLDLSNIGKLEIIKGPAGSLYGAGTGGVVLISSAPVTEDKVIFSGMAGSFGLFRSQVTAQMHSNKVNARIQYAHQQSEGYRDQSAMERDVIAADISFLISKKTTLTSTFFLSDLFYETPGGLTEEQFIANPMQARPAGGPNAGAVEQRAAVANKTPLGGLVMEHEWNSKWLSRISAIHSKSDFENPTIRNYEAREEWDTGARIETQFRDVDMALKPQITFGAEGQYFKSPLSVFGNVRGIKDTLQTDDLLQSRLALGFTQGEITFPFNLHITIGGSLNFLVYEMNRISQTPAIDHEKRVPSVFSPRVAVLQKLRTLSIYANVSRGFSPPSIAEVRPSTNTFNGDLQAEIGLNVEVGFRATLFKNIRTDINLYSLNLDETIVLRRNDDGAEYFINAGQTNQRGLECHLEWEPLENGSGTVSDLKLWTSHSYNHYRFDDYQSGDNLLKGNKVTGVPPTVNLSGIDITVKKFYANITSTYVDHIPLNDTNTAFADDYFLLGARIGFKSMFGIHGFEVFSGVDNAFDKKYSLGNDLNAIGGRYYNAAPTRNFYGGFLFDIRY